MEKEKGKRGNVFSGAYLLSNLQSQLILNRSKENQLIRCVDHTLLDFRAGWTSVDENEGFYIKTRGVMMCVAEEGVAGFRVRDGCRQIVHVGGAGAD